MTCQDRLNTLIVQDPVANLTGHDHFGAENTVCLIPAAAYQLRFVRQLFL